MIDKKFPRTLQEAFGPYTSSHIHEAAPRSSLAARIAYGALVAVAAGSFLVQVLR